MAKRDFEYDARDAGSVECSLYEAYSTLSNIQNTTYKSIPVYLEKELKKLIKESERVHRLFTKAHDDKFTDTVGQGYL